MGSNHAIRKTFKAGEIIFHEGDIRDFAYIIESGQIRIARTGEDENPHIMAELGASSIIGEMALIEPGLRAATATAIEDTVTYAISAHVLEDRMHELDPIVTLLIGLLVEQYRFNRIEKGYDHEKIRQFESLIPLDHKKSKALKSLGLEQEIRHALEKGEFVPYLQPIINLNTQKIIGFETLIRWHHPERGVIMPVDFIPVAERTNMIRAIDRKMLENACDILPLLHEVLDNDPDKEKPFISVNLSAVNFDDDSMIQQTQDIIGQSKANAGDIRLEITESAFIGNSESASNILEGLKELGVSIALDDFGVGYSSLGYLHRFAIDGIKIDKSFIQRMRDDNRSSDIIEAIINLAKTFDLDVTAEGIETEADAQSLQNIGCQIGQGFLYSKAMTVENALETLKKQQ